MTGVSIKYGDVAPEAKETFVAEADDSQFDSLAQLRQYNLAFPNYGNPCELYSVALDGNAVPLPDEDVPIVGMWSKQISGSNGLFQTPVTLTLTSDALFTSKGLTFTFDTVNNIYPTNINIHWWRDAEGTLTDLGEVDFAPDSAFYYCANAVEYYNRIVITFSGINMPYNRLKLRLIDYGYGTIFKGDELRSVAMLQEINPISQSISINTCDFTIVSTKNIEYSFAAKQPISIYHNGKLRATNFVDLAVRQSKNVWNVKTEDYIGIADGVPFGGGVYEKINAIELLNQICEKAKIPVVIEGIAETETLTGYIPYTTCREALMQVLFVLGAVADTSNSDVLNIYRLDNEVKQTIPLERIKVGQKFTENSTVTSVTVTAYTYAKKEELTESDAVFVYEAATSGTGEDILVKFNEPLYNIYWSSGHGSVKEYGANYAILTANDEDFKMWGFPYDVTTVEHEQKNPLVVRTDIEKVYSVTNATLVNPDNVSSVIDRLYEWATRPREISMKIIEGKHISGGVSIKWGDRKWGSFKWGEKTPRVVEYDKEVNVGDLLKTETEYLGTLEGRVIKQKFSYVGGIVVKEATLK